jgi:hypothetical protein
LADFRRSQIAHYYKPEEPLQSITNKNRLAKIQKKAIRIVTGSAYNAHTAPLFVDHNILNFEKIIKQGVLNFMHAV